MSMMTAAVIHLVNGAWESWRTQEITAIVPKRNVIANPAYVAQWTANVTSISPLNEGSMGTIPVVLSNQWGWVSVTAGTPP